MENEESARVYAEYLKTFNVPSTGAVNFVRAGDVPMESQAAVPDVEIPPEAPQTYPATNKRQMDSFLEEIKREDEIRRRLLSQVDEAKSTCLQIQHLSLQITAEQLCKLCAVFGPIASVKLQKPKSDYEKSAQVRTAFVAFMERKDALAAMHKLNVTELKGSKLSANWYKPIVIPEKALYEHRQLMPFTAKLVELPDEQETSLTNFITTVRPEIQVSIPNDVQILKRIHRVIEFVLLYGSYFEAALMKRESQNLEFAFLFNCDLPEHVYYRWKLYSLLNGDSIDRWSVKPFYMYADGPIWIPPSTAFYDDGPVDGTNEQLWEWDSEVEAEGKQQRLTPRARRRFEIMLRRLTTEKHYIATASAFAIDYSAVAEEMSDILIQSILIFETSLPVKTARLYLLSDILHNVNASVDNVKCYFEKIESALPDIFNHLGKVYRNISARLKAETFKRSVLAVLSSWEARLVFSHTFIEQLRRAFLGTTSSQEEQQTKKSDGQAPQEKEETAEDRERRKLWEIESQVAEYARKLKEQSRIPGVASTRRKPNEIQELAQKYREDLLAQLKKGSIDSELPQIKETAWKAPSRVIPKPRGKIVIKLKNETDK